MMIYRVFTPAMLSMLAAAAMVAGSLSQAQAEDAIPGAKYVGAKKCKNCHRSKSKGDQYGKWEESKHAKAFETLATDAAKTAGKAKGVDAPQTSDQCLKCHVTGKNDPKAKLDRRFKAEAGVQCESCHGPGSVHAKNRLSAAAEVEEDEEPPVPSAEVLAKEIHKGSKETCLKCHNKESPTFKEFDYDEQWKKIAHPKP